MPFYRIESLTPCSIPGCSNRLHYGSWAFIEEKGTDYVAKGKVFCVEHATGLSPEDAALCNSDKLSPTQQARAKALDACEDWRKANAAMWVRLTSRKTTDVAQEYLGAAKTEPEKPKKADPPKAEKAPAEKPKAAPKKATKKSANSAKVAKKLTKKTTKKAKKK